MTPYLQDADVTLYAGDALEVLRTLPDRSIHMCATSPPFYGLRDYGMPGQIGLEESPDEWVARLVEVFREVRRVLRDDGTLWVEIGDSYAAARAGHTGGEQTIAPLSRGEGAYGPPRKGVKGARDAKSIGLKHKDLLGQPWLLAQALRDPYYTGKIKREADRVWLAAMVDGEGCIQIHRRPAGQKAYSKFTKKDGTESEYVRKQDSFQPKVEITNTSRRLMDRVVALAGGNCETKQEAGTHGRKQTIYRWTLTADKARDFLRELYPHLVGKQHEARLAFGCPSSGDKAARAHEALKSLHRGEESTGIDFPAPESLFEAGWFLRSEIIWARRPNPMPESVTDRPTKAHSTVFLLSKMPRYYWDQEALREVAEYGEHHAKYQGTYTRHKVEQMRESGAPNGDQYQQGLTRPAKDPYGRNIRSVWNIVTEPTPFAHFATWPQKLVSRMISAGCAEDGTVLDCFAGSGTTLLVARKLGRRAIGIELNESYCELAAKRLAQQSLFAVEA